MSIANAYCPETLVAHADASIHQISDIPPAIHQSAPFRASLDDQLAEMSNSPGHARNDARDGDPTLARVESIAAALEGAEGAPL